MSDFLHASDVKTIITHADCADGMLSALLLWDACPNAKVEFVAYNTPAHLDLPATQGMVLCDMTPPPGRVAEFVKAGAYVLDHHEGAEDIVRQFGGRGVYESGAAISGASLAFKHVWNETCGHGENTAEYRAARHLTTCVASYDTWYKDLNWGEARACSAALRFYTLDDLWNKTWREILENCLCVGKALLRREEIRDTQAIAEAFRFQVGEVKVLCVEGVYVNEILDRLGDEFIGAEPDLVLGWHYRMSGAQARLKVSCRTRGAFPALAFAKSFKGGGGQSDKAAGFTIDAGLENPYRTLVSLVTGFLKDA